jgi:hypothetical protein
LHVGYFHCSESSEVNFGVLDVDILFLMITCRCIETKSITLVDPFFYHCVNNLLLKSHIITLMDEMDFIYIPGTKLKHQILTLDPMMLFYVGWMTVTTMKPEN